MNNAEQYRKVMDTYTNHALLDHAVPDAILQKGAGRRRSLPLRSLTAAALALVLLSSLMVAGAMNGWGPLANIFEELFGDPITANIINEGVLQPLNIVRENAAAVLTLEAFTGDAETHVLLFALTPKEDLGDFDRLVLVGKTYSPGVVEAGLQDRYGESEVEGAELNRDEESGVCFFSYTLPPFWVRDNTEDVILYVSRLLLYKDGANVQTISCDASFQFSPDRAMLRDAYEVNPGKTVSKEVFDYIGFFENESFYEQYRMDTASVVSPKTEAAVTVDTVIFSIYKTEVRCTIQGASLTETQAWGIWNQFTEPWFATQHRWDGMEKASHYDMVSVENTERLRLFADGVEISLIPESLKWVPSKGHDMEGMFTEGEYGCFIQFEGIDYENASEVEIRFGDTVIPLK